MAKCRSKGRDVHIFDATKPEASLGGLILTRGITNANLYAMIEILCKFDQSYYIRDEAELTVQKSVDPLLPGKYFLVSEGSITISNEPWLVCSTSAERESGFTAFQDSVRERDQGCFVTGQRANAPRGDWTCLEAAHVFPLAYQNHWAKHNYGRWITIPTESGGSINSVQNGMLMLADIHILFDNYQISVNPDDGYKIVCFVHDWMGIAGSSVNQRFIDDPRRPVDQLLRWHFRQSVLANMRGAGEPIFECDFPKGSDLMSEIVSGPLPAERMEFELFGRLATSTDILD